MAVVTFNGGRTLTTIGCFFFREFYGSVTTLCHVRPFEWSAKFGRCWREHRQQGPSMNAGSSRWQHRSDKITTVVMNCKHFYSPQFPSN